MIRRHQHRRRLDRDGFLAPIWTSAKINGVYVPMPPIGRGGCLLMGNLGRRPTLVPAHD